MCFRRSLELLLRTSESLKTCFGKLSRATQYAGFDEFCAPVVVGNTSTASTESPDIGLSALPETQFSKRLVVPTGKKPLDLFDHRVCGGRFLSLILFVSSSCRCHGVFGLVHFVRS